MCVCVCGRNVKHRLKVSAFLSNRLWNHAPVTHECTTDVFCRLDGTDARQTIHHHHYCANKTPQHQRNTFNTHTPSKNPHYSYHCASPERTPLQTRKPPVTPHPNAIPPPPPVYTQNRTWHSLLPNSFATAKAHNYNKNAPTPRPDQHPGFLPGTPKRRPASTV